MLLRVSLVCACLLVACTTVYSQKKPRVTYYDAAGNSVESVDQASRFTVFQGKGKRKKRSGSESTFLIDSTIVKYVEYVKGKQQGHSFQYDPETRITLRGLIEGDVKIGNWYTTDSLSNIINMTAYDKMGREVISTDLSASGNTIFRKPDIPAQYPGGNSAWNSHLKKNLKYPLSAMKEGLSGDVVLEFYTAKDGSIMDIFVLSSPGVELSREAMRIVRLGGEWSPAIKNNQPVNGMVELKVKFNLAWKGVMTITSMVPIPRTPYPIVGGFY